MNNLADMPASETLGSSPQAPLQEEEGIVDQKIRSPLELTEDPSQALLSKVSFRTHQPCRFLFPQWLLSTFEAVNALVRRQLLTHTPSHPLTRRPNAFGIALPSFLAHSPTLSDFFVRTL